MSKYAKGEDIYQEVQDQVTRQDQLLLIGRLTPIQRKEYKNYLAKLRQAKYRKANVESANEKSKIAMKKLRDNDPEKYKKMNIEHNKIYREKQRLDIQKKETNTIVKDILNDVIDNVVQKCEKEKHTKYMREYMRQYRANKKAIKAVV